MKLPQMSDRSIMRPKVQTKWGGINHNKNAGGGEIYDMQNMSSREYPLIAPRKYREIYRTVGQGVPLQNFTPFRGIGAQDGMWWVTGNTFYYNGSSKFGHNKEEIRNSVRQFAVMGEKVIVFPDKYYYDVRADKAVKMEVSVPGTTFPDPLRRLSRPTFMDGEIAGVPARANTIRFSVDNEYADQIEFPLRENDTVKISGCTAHPANNVAATIREIVKVTGVTETYWDLHFDELTFEPADEPYTESQAFVSRTIPDLDYICVNENRLWGCKGDTIYASALGDPMNFETFDGLSTDSWTSDTVGAGDFTGCVSFQGYPIFFKPDAIVKVQGDKPSNFQWTLSNRLGVKPGCAGSIALAGDTLFYLSRAGICAYSGGNPVVISDALGANTKWAHAVGGSDGVRYYACMTDGNAYYIDESEFIDCSLYMYDTRYGEWWKQDTWSLYKSYADEYPNVAVGFAFYDEELYMGLLNSSPLDSSTLSAGRIEKMTSDVIPRYLMPWYVEFGDETRFYETTDTGSENKKGLLRLQVRCELEYRAHIEIWVSYDGGDWEKVAEIAKWSDEADEFVAEKKKSYNIPLILRRCDYYRIRIAGSNQAVIYSIAEVKYSGSNLQGGQLYSQGNT